MPPFRQPTPTPTPLTSVLVFFSPDHQHLKLGADDHLITIASAGCNIMDFLVDGCAVTAVDLNQCQVGLGACVIVWYNCALISDFQFLLKLALCELRCAFAKTYDHETNFAIFGDQDMALARRLYVI